MNSHADEQRRRNLQRRDSWEQFADHRRRTTRLLIQSAAADGRSRLCVLGAGNCNDLDLAELFAPFKQIHLVDLDAEALNTGIQQQGLAASDRLILHVQDLTGVIDHVDALDPNQLLDALAQVPHVSDVKHDVVASVCTLTQLIEVGVKALGTETKMIAEIIFALRQQHLNLMISLLKPGGVGLLITDFVSSDTCPGIRTISDDQLPAAAGRWIAERNFFTGVNPFAIRQYLQRDRSADVDPTSIALHKPWRWDLGPRLYAVAAIQFRRSTTSEPIADGSEK